MAGFDILHKVGAGDGGLALIEPDDNIAHCGFQFDNRVRVAGLRKARRNGEDGEQRKKCHNLFH